MNPIGRGLLSLALVSVLFEPLRLALWRLGDEVGGVGGVGGLTNQFGPSSVHCENSTNVNVTETPYCFRHGWLGFTPFGGIMLALCTLPLGLAALAAHRVGSAPKQPWEAHVDAPRDAHDGCVAAFSWIGGCASSLWFLVPLAYYVNAPFYQEDVWHVILAVAIAASYPLSWHLSFVAIPSSAAPFLAPLLGLTPATLKACHVRAAWATVFWGSLHAVGELVYLASQGMLGLLWFGTSNDGSGSNEGDNLTFFFGGAVLLLLLALSAHAIKRRSSSVAATFRRNHRALAAILLLTASAHWWPFVIFLAPAVACAATGRAVDSMRHAGRSDAALALAAAITATLAGIVPVWAARQAWKMAHPTQYYTLPLHMFPPAALGLAFILARGSAMAVVVATTNGIDSNAIGVTRRQSRETPLLDPVAGVPAGYTPPVSAA